MWKTVKLEEVCKIISGNSIPAKKKEEQFSGVEGIPYVATKDVGFDGSINYENGIYIPDEYRKNFKTSPIGSTLVCAEGGSAGRKIAFSKAECCFVNKLFSLQPKENIIPKFIYYYTLSIEFQSQFKEAMHGLIGGVSLSKIKSFSFSLPPLSEQQHIVAKLDAAFAEIDKSIEAAVTKENEVQKLKASLLSSYLDGDNLMWNKLVLDDACNLITRGISPKYLETGGVRVINQKCIRNHSINYSLTRRHDIAKKNIREERIIQKGDVLINSTGHGTLGRVAQVRDKPDEPTTVDSHVTIIRPRPELFFFDFFGYAAIYIEDKIKEAGQGTSGQTELPKTKLKEEFFVSFPSDFDEQQRMAAKLDVVFNEIKNANKALSESKSNYIALKSSILRQVLQSGVA